MRALAPIAVLALLGCSSLDVEPRFDAAAHLQGDLLATLGTSAADIDLPFVLDPEGQAWAREVLPLGGSQRARLNRLLDGLAALHLRYVREPTRDASAVLRTREANCLSFVHLFVALARHLGLEASYLAVVDLSRWDQQGGAVVSRGHVVAGVEVGGELRTYDFLPYHPASYPRLRPIDDRRALAHHFNNLGAEALFADDVELAEGRLRRAVEVDSAFVEGLNNLGVVTARKGRLEEADELFRRGLELDPDDVALLGNRARLAQRQGRGEEADELLEHIARLRHENPFFHIYLGDVALERGDAVAALDSMREALGRDPELPDAHLGMVRALFALGELERARHHLARARRLDPSHRDLAHWEELLMRPDPPR